MTREIVPYYWRDISEVSSTISHTKKTSTNKKNDHTFINFLNYFENLYKKIKQKQEEKKQTLSKIENIISLSFREDKSKFWVFSDNWEISSYKSEGDYCVVRFKSLFYHRIDGWGHIYLLNLKEEKIVKELFSGSEIKLENAEFNLDDESNGTIKVVWSEPTYYYDMYVEGRSGKLIRDEEYKLKNGQIIGAIYKLGSEITITKCLIDRLRHDC